MSSSTKLEKLSEIWFTTFAIVRTIFGGAASVPMFVRMPIKRTSEGIKPKEWLVASLDISF